MFGVTGGLSLLSLILAMWVSCSGEIPAPRWFRWFIIFNLFPCEPGPHGTVNVMSEICLEVQAYPYDVFMVFRYYLERQTFLCGAELLSFTCFVVDPGDGLPTVEQLTINIIHRDDCPGSFLHESSHWEQDPAMLKDFFREHPCWSWYQSAPCRSFNSSPQDSIPSISTCIWLNSRDSRRAGNCAELRHTTVFLSPSVALTHSFLWCLDVSVGSHWGLYLSPLQPLPAQVELICIWDFYFSSLFTWEFFLMRSLANQNFTTSTQFSTPYWTSYCLQL